MDWMPQAIREGIFTIIFISGPLVVLAAVLGLSVGVIQAATQIQEQTLGSAVKIIGLFLALIVFGFYMFQYLRQYAIENIERAFRLVPSLGNYVKPRNNFLTQKAEGVDQRPGIDIPGLIEGSGAGASASKIADSVNAPDLVNINVDREPDRMAVPNGQIKEEDPNIKKIEDAFKAADPVRTEPQPQTTRPQPANTTPRQVVSPAPANTNSNPTTNQRQEEPKPQKPKNRERKSLTGALDKIRSSIDEFNQNNPEGVE